MTDVRASLNHIVEAIDRVAEYTKAGFEAFDRSQLVEDPLVRQLEIIGEAARRIRDATGSRPRQPARENRYFSAHPDVPWKEMIDFRRIAGREYERVDTRIVWNVVTELPAIRRRILKIRG